MVPNRQFHMTPIKDPPQNHVRFGSYILNTTATFHELLGSTAEVAGGKGSKEAAMPEDVDDSVVLVYRLGEVQESTAAPLSQPQMFPAPNAGGS